MTDRYKTSRFGAFERMLCLTGALHFLLFNVPLLFANYGMLQAMAPGRQIGWHEIIIYVGTLGMLYAAGSFLLAGVLCLWRVTYVILTPLLFGLSAILSYFIYFYKITFTSFMMEAIFIAPKDEASDFMSLPLLLWVGLALLVSGFLVRVYLRAKPRVSKIQATLLLIILPVLIVSEGGSVGVPLNFISAAFFYEIETLHHHTRETFDAVKVTDDAKFTDDLTVVLVIGESVRSDHWHINGYSRPITPFLDAMSNVVNFPDAWSCANATDPSVSCLLTGASPETLQSIYTRPGFLGLFRRMGFTVDWITNNSAGRAQGMNYRDIINAPGQLDSIKASPFTGSYDMLISERLLEGGKASPVDTDDNLLPMFDYLLAKRHGRSFIVVHLEGSHWSYYTQYPTSFEKYTPVCRSTAYFECTRESIINAYDNSILHTDWLLHEIISRIGSRKAMLWYASDHGELLGERGRWNHLNPDKGPEQYHIPMFWWGSESLVKSDPQILNAIKGHEKDKVSHTNLFSSILNCASIEASVVDKSLSFCH